jgi:hypothetical protein
MVSFGRVWHRSGSKRAKRWAYSNDNKKRRLQVRSRGGWKYSGKWHVIQARTKRR